ILTVAVFRQLPSFDFINLDDNIYVTDNTHVRSGLTIENIRWSFETTYANFWHPLTWLSHMLDCRLFGLNPGMHHFSALLLHILNTLLLFTVFNRMTGKQMQSAVVAVLFAVHPLHVESVAWISERKDVLSTLFWLLTMYAYACYVEVPKTGRYIAVLLLYIMGLMAKPMLVTLPFVLLLMDFWPLNRFRPFPADEKNSQSSPGTSVQRLIFEKVPFFVIAFVFSIICVIAQGKAVQTLDSLPLSLRLLNVFISYSQYLSKTIWPSHLSVFYPYPESYPVWQVSGAVLLLVSVSVIMICTARKYPYLAVGWLWFIGTLVPVSGLVQVGSHAMADRYTYVPLIGLFIIVAWGGRDLFIKKYHLNKKLSVGLFCTLLAALMVCSFLQVSHWRNSISLFSHAIEVTDNNWLAYNNLGTALSRIGKIKEAMKNYSIVLRIKPDHFITYNNLGLLLAKKNRVQEAVNHFNKAVRLKPDYAEAYNNLGVAMAKQGKFKQAIEHFQKALDLKPDYTKARIHLKNAIEDYKNNNDVNSP
ncbi:MAG: hypothetical protein DRH32_09110, partial [Deltaproteobacteria bacterium]